MHAIYWFRQDLRLSDQAVLAQVCTQATTLLPVYCLNPALFETLPLGFAKTGPWRARFLLESLWDLKCRLREKGSDLYVFLGAPESVLPPLAAQIQADVIYASAENLPEERAEAEALQQALLKGGPLLHLHPRESLLPAENLPFALADLPPTFTPFRKKVEAQLRVPAPAPPVSMLPPLPPHRPECPEFPTLQTLGITPPQDDPRAVLRFEGGESAAQARLHDYIRQRQLIRSYKETRNGMVGEAYSSKFSPWLANGSLSARQVHAEILTHEAQWGANDSTYWLCFELLWREYFRWVGEQAGFRLFVPGGLKGKAPAAQADPQLFARWCKGQTGQPFIDAHLLELAHSGWMSNRGRQNVASYLIHDLKLPWTWGAAWFEHGLVDYDANSNWGNWAYLAGVGNDPMPSRRFDPIGQAQRYDPAGQFQALWAPRC